MTRREVMARRGALVVVCVASLLVTACLSGSPVLAAEGACPNEVRRGEQSSIYLPGCRAYEQVTPVAKDSGEPQPVISERFEPTRGALVAVDGDRMAWITEYPGLSGPESNSLGLDYLSTRGPTGWGTEVTVPPQSPETGLGCPENPGIVGWSRNFTKGVLADGTAQESGNSGSGEAFVNEGFGCGHDEPRLVEGEPEGFQNLFLRDNEAGSYQLVNVTPPTAPHPMPRENAEFQVYFHPNYLAGSADLEHVAFEDELPLTEEAEKLSSEVEAACKEEPKGRACWEGHDDLYVWSEGPRPAVRLASILPDGKPVDGVLAGSTRNAFVAAGNLDHPINIADYRHAVSEDGARIFFEAEGNLYVRENGGQPQSALGPKGKCTEPAKACTIRLDLPQGGAGSGGGGRWLGANAEGTTVFFTDEASAGLTATTVEGSGANLYEYELPSETGASGTLVDLTPGVQAEVLGMSGVSEDGSYVYFAAKGKLTGKYEVAGRSSGQPEPSEGADNLYASHEGSITFIATLSEKDECDWTSNTGCYPEELSNPRESGSTARVSGNGRYVAFNSVNQITPYDNKTDEEIYLYEAEGNQLSCVSCNPNGAPSAGGAAVDWPTTVDRSGNILRNAYPQRNVSEAGQVFFETPEALLPRQDTNGLSDVYEYEHGALHLISSGMSAAPSYFLGASANGSDVFFATAQKLLHRDTDAVYDIYDARVEGGFPEPPTPPPPCESEECKGATQVPAVFAALSSTIFTGTGNLAHSPNKTAKQGRNAMLHRALQECARRYRHNRHRRRECQQHVRKRVSQKAKASGRRGGAK